MESLNHEMSACERYSDQELQVSLTVPMTDITNQSRHCLIKLSILPNPACQNPIFCVCETKSVLQTLYLKLKSKLWIPERWNGFSKVTLPVGGLTEIGSLLPYPGHCSLCWAHCFPWLCPFIHCPLRSQQSGPSNHSPTTHRLTGG